VHVLPTSSVPFFDNISRTKWFLYFKSSISYFFRLSASTCFGSLPAAKYNKFCYLFFSRTRYMQCISLAVHSDLFGLVWISHHTRKTPNLLASLHERQTTSIMLTHLWIFWLFLVCTTVCCIASGSPDFVFCRLEFVKATVPNKVHIDIHSENVEMGWLKFSDVTPNDQRQSFESK